MIFNRHLSPERLAAHAPSLFARMHLRSCIDCSTQHRELNNLRLSLSQLPELPAGIIMPTSFDVWRNAPLLSEQSSSSFRPRLVLRLGSLASVAAGALLMVSSLGMGGLMPPVADQLISESGAERAMPEPDAGISTYSDGEALAPAASEDESMTAHDDTDEANDFSLLPIGILLLTAGAIGVGWSVRPHQSVK